MMGTSCGGYKGSVGEQIIWQKVGRAGWFEGGFFSVFCSIISLF
jgi:hypothetical protein